MNVFFGFVLTLFIAFFIARAIIFLQKRRTDLPILALYRRAGDSIYSERT